MRVRIETGAFDPWDAVRRHQAEALADRPGQYGATAVFVGTMRDFNEGDAVRGLRLEHYPGMTERRLHELVDIALDRWPLVEALVVHRVGELRPDDPIVLTAAWSAHRGAAFEAARFLIEELKHRAPFWKQETLTDGSTRWVEHNTPA